jgi:hypothetical protein
MLCEQRSPRPSNRPAHESLLSPERQDKAAAEQTTLRLQALRNAVDSLAGERVHTAMTRFEIERSREVHVLSWSRVYSHLP